MDTSTSAQVPKKAVLVHLAYLSDLVEQKYLYDFKETLESNLGIFRLFFKNYLQLSTSGIARAHDVLDSSATLIVSAGS